MADPPKADDFGSCIKHCLRVSAEYVQPFLCVPENFSCAKDGSEVIFLSGTDLSGNSLYAAPLEGEDHKWRMVESPRDAELSHSQQLLRERMRATSSGITHYKYIASGDKVLVDTGSGCRLLPRLLTASSKVVEYPDLKGALDYKLCPGDEEILACVHDGDLWLLDARSSCIHQLTNTASERPSRRLTAGHPSFIMQEEFDRYTGYWWSPASGGNGKHQIFYEEVDETQVEVVHTLNPSKQLAEDYRFPRPGNANASSTLKMVEFTVEGGKLSSEVKFVAPSNAAYVAKWEYIPRLGWTPDGDGVWFQLLDREQHHLQILMVSSTNFLSSERTEADNSTVTVRHPLLLWEEKADPWISIDCQGCMEFFPPSCSDELKFVTISKTSGFPHLVLVCAKKGVESLCSSGMAEPVQIQLSVTLLTTGQWSVLGSSVWIDNDNEIVYFQGNKTSCLEQHLFAIKLSDSLPSADPAQLTPSGYYHTPTVFAENKLFVSAFSSRAHAPAVGVFKVDHAHLTAQRLFDIKNAAATPKSYIPPTSFTADAPTGEVLHGVVYPPCNKQDGQKYPTVVFVYGGPEIQLVTNEFSRYIMRIEQFIQAGMAVVVLDNRGTAHRGSKFEGHIKGIMGSIEVEDQVAGLKAAATVADYIDLERVGIYGWSYGGYLSLMCIAKKSQEFKLAVSGAPVTDFMWYDTGYTERYLGIPPATEKNYLQSSVLSCAAQLPNEPNRLLIIHGMNDENVLFTHTTLLLDAMVSVGKPYQLQVFTGERHGIRSPVASAHSQATVLAFLLRHL